MTIPRPLTEAEVSQADRDAAKAFDPLLWEEHPNGPDFRRLIQAFARHRLSTSAQPSTEAVKLAGETCPIPLRDAIFSAEHHGCDLLLGLDRVCEYAKALRQSPPLPSSDEVRRQALEEAARRVETHHSFPKPTSRAAQYYEREVLKPVLASAIRALNTTKDQSDG